MKAETLRKYYRGPAILTVDGMPTFQWSQKRKGYPRLFIRLIFDPVQREFFLNSQKRTSSRQPFTWDYVTGDDLLATLRSLLPPEHLARCTAASIAATRNSP